MSNNNKIDNEVRKGEILLALKTSPMNYRELGKAVKTYRLTTLVADLKGEKKVYWNQTEKRLELWK